MGAIEKPGECEAVFAFLAVIVAFEDRLHLTE